MKVIQTLVRFYVENLDSALFFYEKLLGIKACLRFQVPGAGIEQVQVGDILLIAGSDKALKPYKDIRATLLVDSIDDFKAFVQENGSKIISGPQSVSDGRNMMTVQHPDGTVVEYVEHFATSGRKNNFCCSISNYDPKILPQPVLNLPDADMPFKGINVHLSRGDSDQFIFMEFAQDADLPEHAHASQCKKVVENKVYLISIREMNIADYDDVINLWKNTEGMGLSEADSRENIGKYLDRNPGFSFVAQAGEEIVGAVLCGYDGRRGFLHHLAVRTDYRRQGLGRQMTNCCLAKLSKEGITKCHLFIFKDNRAGLEFWIGGGWVKREDVQIISKNI